MSVSFSIVTPSFRQLPWLKRCVRSVADQKGVSVQHVIQDNMSGPDVSAWLADRAPVDFVSEPDSGMYDALNRGLARCSGDLIGLLNCDEQYLPGTLQKAAELFHRHPDADLVAGDFLVVDREQELIAFRRATPLRASMILTDHLYAFTCALFFRRRLFEEIGGFDTTYQSVADAEWVARALLRGSRAVLLHDYLATFTWTGENLSAQAISRAEERRLSSQVPIGWRVATPALRLWRRAEKWWHGGYAASAVEYASYVGEDDESRSVRRCERPSYRYPATLSSAAS